MAPTNAQSVTSPTGLQQPPDTDRPSVDIIQGMVTEAIESKNVEKVRSLLAQYPDVPLSEETLRLASHKGSIPIFEALAEKDPSIVHTEFEREGTPLTLALLSRTRPSFISHLLSLGADPNHLVDGAFMYPLACAAFSGDEFIETIALLLGKGASLDYSGALHVAANFGHVETTRFLLDHGAAPMKDAPEAYLRPSNDNPMSPPLRSAILYNHPVIVRLLLDHGGEAGVWNDNGGTALQLAEEKGREEILNFLRAYIPRGINMS